MTAAWSRAMPDHINDIPLEQLRIYEDGELVFDGSDPDTFVVVLDPGISDARLADRAAGRSPAARARP